MLKLPDDIGASPEALWEFTLRGRDKVCDVSEAAISFCLDKGISRRTASFAGLCIAFDPRKRIEQFHPEDPSRNIGIRLTAGIARQIDYYNNAGVNTLIMKL